jgi:glycyl-tRNA synthetase
MLEINSTCLTPEPVLKASGHVDKFADLLITDVVTRQGYRADKLVSEFLETRLAKEKLTPEEQLDIK